MRITTLFVLAALLSHERLPADDQEAINWAESHFQEAFDLAFPVTHSSTPGIFVRAYHDLHHSFPEFSIALTYEFRSGEVTAQIREVDTSLFLQLQSLHRDHPAASLQVLLSALKVRTLTVSDKSCSAVRSAKRAFEQLRFGPPSVDTLILHPVVYQVRVNGTAGSLSYDIVESTAAVSAWARRSIARIRQCHGRAA